MALPVGAEKWPPPLVFSAGAVAELTVFAITYSRSAPLTLLSSAGEEDENNWAGKQADENSLE